VACIGDKIYTYINLKERYLFEDQGIDMIILWDTVGSLKNDYSTPTVNNIYLSSACTVSNLGSIQPGI